MGKQFKILGWSIVFLIATLLVLCFYTQEWMFLDGITYTAISRNLYLGYGSFWKPYYNENINPFYIHPPLMFWLLSKFYWLLGDHTYVPKIYNAIVLLLSVITIRSIWVKIDEENKKIDWWPVLLWICAAVVFETSRNTMLECTLSLFALASIRFLLSVVTSNTKTVVVTYIFIGGFFIFLAFVTKGFVALFPMAFITIYTIIYKQRITKMLGLTFLLIAVFSVLYIFFITINSSSNNYISIYYQEYVFKSISNKETFTQMGRWFLIKRLFLEILPFIVLAFVFIIISKKRSFEINWKIAAMFFLIGVSASLPLFISQKQRIHYLYPSFPYFILSVACVTKPLLLHWLSKLKQTKVTIYVSVVLFIFSIGYLIYFSQQKQMDADLISDCKKINGYFPDKVVLSTTTNMVMNEKITAYLSMIGVITLSDKIPSDYLLLTKGESYNDKMYREVNIELKKFDLYENIQINNQ